ncbi:phosphomannomutase/phosphoglucomutase [filamentous cyanobacterium CCP5]|nr:phosphomannomutase/phosphoglucomutase [filamentous cyanobacterium CCP5]
MSTFNWKQLQNGSDIRGVALDGIPGEPVNLTPEVACTLGGAFAQWLAQTLGKAPVELTVAIGRDSRLSGPDLMAAAIKGLSAMGAQVYDCALGSTPAMFMSTVIPGFECDGAIMLTASHLPWNRNGMKFFTRQGGVDKTDINAMLALAEAGQFKQAAAPGHIESRDLISAYADGLVQQIRQSVKHPENFNQPLKGLKVIVDAGNGAGGFYASKVLEPLGADTTGSQFLEPDGTFPNHVPNPENAAAMAAICNAVVEHKADFGLIFDTDVDRGAAVDHTGRELNRNRLIALISAIALQEHPGSTVVTDSITSEGLTRFIEEDLGGSHHRFRRGYKNVINEAIRLNRAGQECWLAIETSGHGAMRENYFLDDGAYLVSKLLVELARCRLSGKSLPDLIANLQEPIESEEFRLKILAENFKTHGQEVISKLEAFVATQDGWEIAPNSYEGVRVRCQNPAEQGWFLLRLSLHDPVLPLNVESNMEGGVEQIVAKLRSFLKAIPKLDLSALG